MKILIAIVEEERNSLQLQVTLKHGLTGLSKVFSMEYVTVMIFRPDNLNLEIILTLFNIEIDSIFALGILK